MMWVVRIKGQESEYFRDRVVSLPPWLIKNYGNVVIKEVKMRMENGSGICGGVERMEIDWPLVFI